MLKPGPRLRRPVGLPSESDRIRGVLGGRPCATPSTRHGSSGVTIPEGAGCRLRRRALWRSRARQGEHEPVLRVAEPGRRDARASRSPVVDVSAGGGSVPSSLSAATVSTRRWPTIRAVQGTSSSAAGRSVSPGALPDPPLMILAVDGREPRPWLSAARRAAQSSRAWHASAGGGVRPTLPAQAPPRRPRPFAPLGRRWCGPLRLRQHRGRPDRDATQPRAARTAERLHQAGRDAVGPRRARPADGVWNAGRASESASRPGPGPGLHLPGEGGRGPGNSPRRDRRGDLRPPRDRRQVEGALPW